MRENSIWQRVERKREEDSRCETYQKLKLTTRTSARMISSKRLWQKSHCEKEKKGEEKKKSGVGERLNEWTLSMAERKKKKKATAAVVVEDDRCE